MPDRPFVLLSVAASLDGYIDDAGPERLLLSNDEDFDRVDEVRAGVDAILVGAATVRADNPRLLVRSGARRAGRVDRGQAESPMKVTITAGGALDPAAAFFTAGETDRLVYTTSPAHARLASRLAGIASVVDAGDPLSPETVLADLAARKVSRLLVEGGSAIHTLFLTADLVDELQVVFAPFFVGDAAAPRMVNPGRFPQGGMELIDVRRISDVVLLRYRPTGRTAES